MLSNEMAGKVEIGDRLRVQPNRIQRTLQGLVRFGRQKPLGAVAGLLILGLILTAIFADVLAPYPALQVFKGEQMKAPGAKFLLGSDELGRDVLSRIIQGSRISLQVGIISVGVGTIFGSLIGIVSGYFGGRTDLILQRLMDSLMAFPALILALSIMAVLGPDIKNVMVAIGIVIIPGTSRVVRGATMAVKENQYVEAARAMGAKDLRILAFHIFPNVAAPIVVIATMGLGGAIIAEASLSFLGLGTPPPTPSWGGMMSGAARFRLEQAPWLMWAPGGAISLAVLGFNLLGDALRDVWDPRLRGSR